MFDSQGFIVHLRLEFGHRIWYNMLYNNLLFSCAFRLKVKDFTEKHII